MGDFIESAWRKFAPAMRFDERRNWIGTPAFRLLELSMRDLACFENRGTLRQEICGFPVRRPGRNIREIPASGLARAHPQPAAVSLGGGRRTRWDMDVARFWRTVQEGSAEKAQRVKIEIVLLPGMEFFDQNVLPAITAKDEQSAKALVNLVVDDEDGKPRATFWAIREAGPDVATIAHSFNIAVVAVDEDDPEFALPIIIDPPIINRRID
jgi:hypothetical protein